VALQTAGRQLRGVTSGRDVILDRPWSLPPRTRRSHDISNLPKKLIGSRRRAWRLISARDWITWVHGLALALLLALGWWKVDSIRERSALLADYDRAPKEQELIVLTDDADIAELLPRLEKGVKRWSRNPRVLFTGALVARSALETRKKLLRSEGVEITLDKAAREFDLLLSSLNGLAPLVAELDEAAGSRYQWLRGYEALQRAESARREEEPRSALTFYRQAIDHYKLSGVLLYPELEKVEFRIANTARAAYNNDPTATSGSRPSAAAREWLELAREHARRALDLSKYRGQPGWNTEFVLGATYFEEGRYWRIGPPRQEAFERATEWLISAHKNADLQGRGDYFLDNLDLWLGPTAQLCEVESFATYFTDACDSPVATFRVRGSGLLVVLEYAHQARDLAFEWDVDGDGLADSRDRAIQHEFAEPGDYPVTLKVIEGDGEVRTIETTLTVPMID
jgi:hypothetical protein